MVLFKDLLDCPNGKEWPEIDIDYDSLQDPLDAVKLLESHPVAKWSKEFWGSSYDKKDNCIEFSGVFNLFNYQKTSNKMAWLKHKGGIMVIMNPPSFDKAYKMLLVHVAKEKVKPLKSTLRLIYEEYNPSVRVLLQILQQTLNVDQFIRHVHAEVAALTQNKLDDLIYSGPHPQSDTTNTSKDIAHSLITTFRDFVVPDDVYKWIM
ncbi:hypothetical protein BT96DRAFT_1006696 [Gymnopus androsaceus JB14]|uniref:Uncharacterized protein n=1 Tax=Gymnopus androsaceus JB14 TaxID=1447944 RepID=A0A6A4GKP7_9AGAR|nr:hypothetical protein BT96DRAFT_1006696 [Gymnopus androsaceus JB14]